MTIGEKQLKLEMKDRHKTEANLVGYDLIGYSKAHTIAIYRCRLCGYIFDRKPIATKNSIKKGHNVVCNGCKEIELLDFENKYNISIDRSVTGNIKVFTYNSCGHKSKQPLDNLKKSIANCSCCYEDNLLKAAKDFGIELIGSLDKKGYVLGRFNKCGHEKHFKKIDISKRKTPCTVCKICDVNRFKEEASNVGLEFLGDALNFKHGYRSYKLPCCGSIKDLRLDHVRDGVYTCDICGNSHCKFESDIYLFEITYKDNVWLKLGYSKNIVQRFREYGLPEGAEYKVLKVIKVHTGKEARRIENSIHAKLKNIVIDKNIQLQFHTKSGSSECYEIKYKGLILDILNKTEAECMCLI